MQINWEFALVVIAVLLGLVLLALIACAIILDRILEVQRELGDQLSNLQK